MLQIAFIGVGAGIAAALLFASVASGSILATLLFYLAPLPILIVPDPILRKTARAVTPADAETVKTLIPAMFATMYKAPGIGLAAPQVVSLLRVVVIDLAPDKVPAPLTLINPEIIAQSDELATREEGCLSLPGQYADITRPARVKVRYLDQTGAKREIEGDGLFDACLQNKDILVCANGTQPGRRRPARLHVNQHVPGFTGYLRIYEQLLARRG